MFFALVAQSAEQGTLNPKVEGSIPSERTEVGSHQGLRKWLIYAKLRDSKQGGMEAATTPKEVTPCRNKILLVSFKTAAENGKCFLKIEVERSARAV